MRLDYINSGFLSGFCTGFCSSILFAENVFPKKIVSQLTDCEIDLEEMRSDWLVVGEYLSLAVDKYSVDYVTKTEKTTSTSERYATA